MKPEDLLTIILTLKDRHLFTIRWLDWAIYQNCTFQILIADGSSDDYIQDYLINNDKYNKLNFKYYRYPFDSNIHTWFKKVQSISNIVKTKYCIHADNDDFILFNTLKESVIKFENHKNVNVFSRPQLRIKFHSKIKINDLNQYLYPQKKVSIRKINYNNKFEILYNGSDLDKLKLTILNFEAALVWYGIHTTKNLQRIHNQVLKSNYELAMMQEWFLYYSSPLGGGCVIEDGKPFLVRQEMTSTSAASLISLERLDKIFLNKSWSRDLHMLINDLYSISKINKMKYEEFEFFFKNLFHNYLSSWNKYQFFVDKFKYKPFYKYLKNLIDFFMKIKNVNQRYKSIKSYRNNYEIRNLEIFLNSHIE